MEQTGIPQGGVDGGRSVTTIPIHWAFNARGNWDHGMMMLAEEGKLCDRPDVKFERVGANLFQEHGGPCVRSVCPHTVVCINGGNAYKPEMQEFLSQLRKCLVISLSDEEAKFRPEMVHSSNVVWVQYGQPGKHDAAAKWILTGMRYDTPEMVRRLSASLDPDSPRHYLWSFVGQAQNTTRKEMVAVLMKRPDGLLKITDGFGGQNGDGYDYEEYIDTMLDSDFVLCPAGNVVADSFRFAEALECGAIPIAQFKGEQESDDHIYWERVFGSLDWSVPLYESDMTLLNSLLDVCDSEFKQEHRRGCQELWSSYKRQFVQDIVDTVEGLRK